MRTVAHYSRTETVWSLMRPLKHHEIASGRVRENYKSTKTLWHYISASTTVAAGLSRDRCARFAGRYRGGGAAVALISFCGNLASHGNPVVVGRFMSARCWPKVLLAAKTYGSVFYDKLSPLDSSGEMVGPVRNHVTMKEWGDMSQVFIGNAGVSVCEFPPASPPWGTPPVTYSTHCRPPR